MFGRYLCLLWVRQECTYGQILSSSEDAHPQPNQNAAAESPKRNRFYVLKGREEPEKSAELVTATVHVFSFPVYALLHPGSTLSFVNH